MFCLSIYCALLHTASCEKFTLFSVTEIPGNREIKTSPWLNLPHLWKLIFSVLGCHTLVAPRLWRAGPRAGMLCMCSSVKRLLFSLAPQPRWRLVVITRWWGWCPVGTISTAFPFSTDYWNSTSSPRPRRTVWITSALWNEITRANTRLWTRTRIRSHYQPFLCKYTSLMNALNQPLFFAKYFNSCPHYVSFDLWIFIWEIVWIRLKSFWILMRLIDLFVAVCGEALWYIISWQERS